MSNTCIQGMNGTESAYVRRKEMSSQAAVFSSLLRVGQDGINIRGDEPGQVVERAVERENPAEARAADRQIHPSPLCDRNSVSCHFSKPGRHLRIASRAAMKSCRRSEASASWGQRRLTGINERPSQPAIDATLRRTGPGFKVSRIAFLHPEISRSAAS